MQEFAGIGDLSRDGRGSGGRGAGEEGTGPRALPSVAICRYFEALHADPPLFGRSAVEQGIVEMWIRRIELNFMFPVGMVWVHGSPLTKAVVGNQIEAVAEQNRDAVRRYYDFLDRQLAEREFLAGDAFSMADILCLCTTDFAGQLNELPHPDDREHLCRWYDAVSTRASATA